MDKPEAYEKLDEVFWLAVNEAHKNLNYWQILKEVQRNIVLLMIKSEAEYKLKGG